MSRKWFYDVVVSIYTETCRTECFPIYGGFETEEEALNRINNDNILEADFREYCSENETAELEIEIRDEDNNLIDVIGVNWPQKNYRDLRENFS